jgi:hypothetical protein
LEVEKDNKGMPDLSKSMYDEHMESKSEDDELYNENDSSLSPKISNAKEDGIFTKTFMNIELDDLDEFETSLGSCLDDLFHDAIKTEAPVIYIKDKDYEFYVDPKKIEKAEAIKFNGREDELPWEHLINLSELANVFGNTEIQKRYYFLKLFPFSLGGEAKAWYNSLAPKSITSKEACIYLICNKYFPASKIHAMVEEIIHFAQGKEEGIPQEGIPQLLDIFYNGLTEGSRSYLDSIAGNIFRNMTVEEAKELLDTIK